MPDIPELVMDAAAVAIAGVGRQQSRDNPSRDSTSSGSCGKASVDYGVPGAAEGSDQLLTHPASQIGTPHDDGRSASGIPQSASVVGSRWSSQADVATAQIDEQMLNDRAVSVLKRVKSKLGGSDFPDQASRLDVATQVNRLIQEAQSHMNLCQLYVGWCPFW